MTHIQHSDDYNFYYIDGKAYASQRGIARLTGYDERTVRRTLSSAALSPLELAEVPTAAGLRSAALCDAATVSQIGMKAIAKGKKAALENMGILIESAFTQYVVQETGAGAVELSYQAQQYQDILNRMMNLREQHRASYEGWIRNSKGLGLGGLRSILAAITARFFPHLSDLEGVVDGDYLPDRVLNSKEIYDMEKLVTVRAIYFSKPGLTHEQRCQRVCDRLKLN